jgi:hypothetical protein
MGSHIFTHEAYDTKQNILGSVVVELVHQC